MKETVINSRMTMLRSIATGPWSSVSGYTCLLTVVVVVLLPACASSHIKSTSNPAGMAPGPIRNVTVVGMDERPEFRNPFEDDAVRFLKAHAVEATSSHTRFSLEQMKGNREEIRLRLVDAKAESVLFVHVTDRADVGGGPPASLGSLDMAAVDESRYNLATPGGEVNTKLRLAARLYRVSDGVVIWTGVMNTTVKEDYDSIVLLRGLAKTIVEEMARGKVIP